MIQKEVSNRMFDEMLKAARERLAGRTAEDISAKTAIVYEEEKAVFYLKSLGKDVYISYPDFRCVSNSSEIGEWQLLTILHYMDLEDGTSLGQDIISFSQVKNGMVRGGGFDRQCEQTISFKIGHKPEEVVRNACKKMGAELISSNADVCAVFPYLPLYPVTLKIWFADEDIPGSGRMFLNETADHYLTVEDAVTVGTVILEELVSEILGNI